MKNQLAESVYACFYPYYTYVTFKIILVLSSTSSIDLNHCDSDMDSQFSEGATDAFPVHTVLFIIVGVDLKHYTVYLSHRSG
jgi:hypothetical protein